MIRRGAAGAVSLLLLACAAPAVADVDLGGDEVEASTDRREPTPLEAGTWADTLGPGGGADSVHYFVYRRTMRFSTVHLGVSGANATESSQLTLDVTTPDGDSCGSDIASAGVPQLFATFGTAVAVGSDDLDDVCLRADELHIAVGRGTGTTEEPLPVVLRAVEEAPTDDGATLPEPSATPRVDAPADTPRGSTRGATSYADAPYLEPGRYDTTVAEGEQRLWRVRLDWGQQVSVRVVAEPQDAAADAVYDYDTAAVELVLVDPLLASFDNLVEDADGSGLYGDERVTLVEGSPEVAYRNRFGSGVATVPGDYWVTISVEAADDRAPYDVPLSLAVDVVGEPAGAPTYPPTVQSPDGDLGPEGYDPSTPFLLARDQFAADVSGAPRAEADDTAAGGTDERQVAGLAVGAASLLCCLLGAALLLRRRRVSRAAAR